MVFYVVSECNITHLLHIICIGPHFPPFIWLWIVSNEGKIK